MAHLCAVACALVLAFGGSVAAGILATHDSVEMFIQMHGELESFYPEFSLPMGTSQVVWNAIAQDSTQIGVDGEVATEMGYVPSEVYNKLASRKGSETAESEAEYSSRLKAWLDEWDSYHARRLTFKTIKDATANPLGINAEIADKVNDYVKGVVDTVKRAIPSIPTIKVGATVVAAVVVLLAFGYAASSVR